MVSKVSIHGHTISFCRWGDGHPTLLLHDGSGCAADWRPLLDTLGEHLACYVPDFRSSPSLADTDLPAMLLAFVNNRGIFKVHIVAAGDSECLALAFASRYPRRTGTVVRMGAGRPSAAELLDTLGRRPRLVADDK